MSRFVDIDSWDRKSHYLYFREFDDPFYNICAEVDVTQALKYSKKHQLSFFHICMFLTISAANQIEEFRYRSRAKKIWVHDKIHPSCTVLNKNNTFSFCDFVYVEKFCDFNELATRAKQTRRLPDVGTSGEAPGDDVIYYSVIPWLSFTSFTHPKKGGPSSTIPRIGIGKYFAHGRQCKMPISLEVNHMFIDGYHIGQFFQILQSLLDDPEKWLA